MKNLAIKSNHNLFNNNNKCLFISLSNYGYIDMTENHIISLKKNNIENYIAFVLDEDSYNILSNKGYNVSLYKNLNQLNCEEFATPEFNNICFLRWNIISELLKNKIIVWCLDIDTVALYNLNKIIQQSPNIDLIMQNDINMPCCGCMLFFPTNNTINLSNFIINNKTNKYNDQIFFKYNT